MPILAEYTLFLAGTSRPSPSGNRDDGTVDTVVTQLDTDIEPHHTPTHPETTLS